MSQRLNEFKRMMSNPSRCDTQWNPVRDICVCVWHACALRCQPLRHLPRYRDERLEIFNDNSIYLHSKYCDTSTSRYSVILSVRNQFFKIRKITQLLSAVYVTVKVCNQ